MLQPYEIKLEEEGSTSKKRKQRHKRSHQLPECTCSPQSLSEVLNHSESPKKAKKDRQVLVYFGLKRKKIFTLKSKKDSLHQMFTSFVSGEPAFSKLLDNAYVVIQEYNSKFGTYVDVDHSKNLRDGSVVKAVFFPTRLERDDENPGLIKTKDPNLVQNSSKDLIQINSSDDDDSDEDTTVACEESTAAVDVSLLQTPTKKKRKKKHSQDSQNSLETSAINEPRVCDPSDIEIKLENISVNQFLIAKSSAASSSMISESQNEQVASPIQSSKPKIQGNRSSSHPPATTENEQPLPGGSLLDFALTQNKNQKQSDHVKNISPKTGTQNGKNIVRDAVTRLSEVCKEELLNEPKYVFFSQGQSLKCKVTVKGLTFCGQGGITQLAKQNAASEALEYMLSSPGYSATETGAEGGFAERSKNYENVRRHNAIEEIRKNMIGGENGGRQNGEEYRKKETEGRHRKEESGGREIKEECIREKNGIGDREENRTWEGVGRGGGGERGGRHTGRGRGFRSYRGREGSNRGSRSNSEESGSYGGRSGSYGGGRGSITGRSGSNRGGSVSNKGRSGSNTGRSQINSGESGSYGGGNGSNTGRNQINSGESGSYGGRSGSNTGRSQINSGESGSYGGRSGSYGGGSGNNTGRSQITSGESGSYGGGSGSNTGRSGSNRGGSGSNTGRSQSNGVESVFYGERSRSNIRGSGSYIRGRGSYRGEGGSYRGGRARINSSWRGGEIQGSVQSLITSWSPQSYYHQMDT